MIETAFKIPVRRILPVALLLAAMVSGAMAQAPASPPGQTRNPVCVRLEAQLATVDRQNVDPARAEQIKRYEETARRQQGEIDRLSAQAQKIGCQGRGFFAIFGGQPQQCGPLNNQISQMRANLDRVLGDLQRLQGNSGERDGERRAVLVSLGQNDCGPQYRQFANAGGGGFFDSLFGGSANAPGMPAAPGGAESYRTVCVRTCDGFYFPVSYSTAPGRFADDEQTCRRMCPASEVVLYSHRNPGEDVAQAMAQDGSTYANLPTAFAYRKALNPSCTCKAAGQTWADALKHLDDSTIERGDIVVTEEESRRLSRPVDPKGRPVTPKGAAPKSAPAASATATSQPVETDPAKRQIRSVGPAFLPTR